MRLFVGVTEGKLEFFDLDAEFAAQRYLGAFSPLERDDLVCTIESFIEKGWDGKFQSSASFNWPDEYGWPDKHVETFFRSCIREAATDLCNVESRAESGVVRFGDDWPGYFMRGDEAYGAGMVLKEHIRTLPKPSSIEEYVQRGVLNGLANMLLSTEQKPDQKVIQLRTYDQCRPIKKTEWTPERLAAFGIPPKE